MKPARIAFPILWLLILITTPLHAATFEVHDAEDLHTALAAAGRNGEDDLIKIFEGTYQGNFKYVEEISEEDKYTRLMGGYSAEGRPTGRPGKTILDGNHAGQTLACTVRGALAVMYLTIQNGNTAEAPGGGLAITHQALETPGGALVRGNVIRDNTSHKMGGGVYIASLAPRETAGNVWLLSNHILRNTAAGEETGGGGAYLHITSEKVSQDSARILMLGNTFADNHATAGPGGGAHVRSLSETAMAGNISVSHNTFTGNTAKGYGDNGGGGLFALCESEFGPQEEEADPDGLNTLTLAHNTILDNRCETRGGGAQIVARAEFGLSPVLVLTGNTVSRNTAVSRGGGLQATTTAVTGKSADITFRANRIVRNRVGNEEENGHSGGVRLASTARVGTGMAGQVILVNNLIVNNFSNYWDAGATVSGNIVLTNNTIANNQAEVEGGGIHLIGDLSVRAYNNIVRGNSVPDLRLLNAAVFEGFNNNYATLDGYWSTERDRMDADPRFVGAGDYHLQYISPCRDAGTAQAPQMAAKDYEGDDRSLGEAPDMGADEVLPLFFPEPAADFPAGQPAATEDTVD